MLAIKCKSILTVRVQLSVYLGALCQLGRLLGWLSFSKVIDKGLVADKKVYLKSSRPEDLQ